MKTIVLFKTALHAIARHAGRSFLTVLGIMIGIAAIVITFSIGRGAEEKIRKQIMTMGEGAMYVIPGNVITRGAVRSSLAKPVRLTMRDLEAIRAQCPEIANISRSTFTLETLEYGGSASKDRVLGSDANVLEINKNKLRLGSFFTNEHVYQRIPVAVLGDKIAEKLFGQEYPIGKAVRINGNPFMVIGIMEPQEHFWGTEDPNMRTFVPFTVARKLFRGPVTQPSEDLGPISRVDQEDLDAIAIGARQDADVDVLLRRVKRILRFQHNIRPNEEDDFTILDQKSIARAAQDAAGVIKLFGLIAASISLLVGGIGVMNIMLVSVQERTQEIGLRMALGATKLLVQWQFLIEAMVLCALGGMIGVGLGVSGQAFMVRFTNLPSIIEMMPLVASLLITVLIGMFFGYYPARKASCLNPIDALLER